MADNVTPRYAGCTADCTTDCGRCKGALRGLIDNLVRQHQLISISGGVSWCTCNRERMDRVGDYPRHLLEHAFSTTVAGVPLARVMLEALSDAGLDANLGLECGHRRRYHANTCLRPKGHKPEHQHTDYLTLWSS